jgi:hypothetical protein
MAGKEEGAKKEAGAKKAGKALSDKKRFAYLRIRAGELRNESLAVRKEMTELRAKMAAAKKAKGGGNAKDGDDED